MPSATNLSDLLRCAHRIYLDAHGDPDQKMPTSTFLQSLWEGGREHEENVVSALDLVSAHKDFSQEDRVKETKRLMKEGHALIYHGLFMKDGLVGEPDLLQRVAQASDLGDFAYTPVDIKAAKLTGAHAAPKPQYLVQLCAYAELLESVQGWRPETGIIIDREGAWASVDLAAFWPEYEMVRERFGRIVSTEERTSPGWKADCQMCVWQDVCWKELVAKDDLTLVAGVGESSRDKLITIGIRTVADLSAADPAAIAAIKGIKTKSTVWVRQAKVQKSGVPLVLRAWKPPDVDFEVSYDIEVASVDSFVYLHGLLVRDKGAKKYGAQDFADRDFGLFDPVCAVNPQSEEEVWKAFLAKVAGYEQRGSYCVYIYSSYEKTALKRLAAKYGGTPELESFKSKIIDLMSDLKGSVIFPTDATGLKTIAKHLNFAWRDADPGGAQSTVWWADYWKDPVANLALRQRVIDYNEDDVRASFVVRDWLEKNTATK